MRLSTKAPAMLFLAGLALLLAFGSTAASAGNGDRGLPGLERAVEAQERNTSSLMAIPGVVGTAVGDGGNGRAAVFVFTAEPQVAGIPTKVDGVPVVTHVTGEIFALGHCPDHMGGKPPPGCGNGGENGDELDRTARARPAPLGFSTGHPNITAGSIGARLIDDNGTPADPDDDTYYALSANHVYADTGSANIGDNVLQPGDFDGGVDPGDAIGTLAAFVPIVFDAINCDPNILPDPDCNTVDAAIAESSTANLGNSTGSDGYGTPKSSTMAALFNQKLQKYGRTTGQTKGFVWALNSTVDVNYGTSGSPEIARFVGQIVIKGKGIFSGGGDSGSLVVAEDKNNKRRPVGLLFAGAQFPGLGAGTDFTWANPIGDVLADLEDELGGGATLAIDGE